GVVLAVTRARAVELRGDGATHLVLVHKVVDRMVRVFRIGLPRVRVSQGQLGLGSVWLEGVLDRPSALVIVLRNAVLLVLPIVTRVRPHVHHAVVAYYKLGELGGLGLVPARRRLSQCRVDVVARALKASDALG